MPELKIIWTKHKSLNWTKFDMKMKRKLSNLIERCRFWRNWTLLTRANIDWIYCHVTNQKWLSKVTNYILSTLIELNNRILSTLDDLIIVRKAKIIEDDQKYWHLHKFIDIIEDCRNYPNIVDYILTAELEMKLLINIWLLKLIEKFGYWQILSTLTEIYRKLTNNTDLNGKLPKLTEYYRM